mgnify:CR=1 FL=1
MNRVFWSLLACLLVPTLVAAPVPKSVKKKDDATDIVGLWASTRGGTTGWWFGEDGKAGTGNPVQVGCAAIYKVDATQTPRHLDWSQDNGKTWYLAIYEIENDVLRINFGSNNTGKRPTLIGPNTGSQFETGIRNPDFGKK